MLHQVCKIKALLFLFLLDYWNVSDILYGTEFIKKEVTSFFCLSTMDYSVWKSGAKSYANSYWAIQCQVFRKEILPLAGVSALTFVYPWKTRTHWVNESPIMQQCIFPPVGFKPPFFFFIGFYEIHPMVVHFSFPLCFTFMLGPIL